MKWFLTIAFGVVTLVVASYFFPVVFEGQGELNATTNISEYTGMAEAVSFAPLLLYVGIIACIFWGWWKATCRMGRITRP